MTSDIYVHISDLIETMCFCEHCKKYRKFTQSPGAEILLKWTIFTDPRAIHLKICGNCPPSENLYSRKSEEILWIDTVEATFAIIYLCLLFSTGLDFWIKYVSYDSFKILLSSRIAKSSKIFKFPLPNVLVWLSRSICCNSSCRLCCL